MVGNYTMHFEIRSSLKEPLSLHCAFARSGRLTLTLISFFFKYKLKRRNFDCIRWKSFGHNSGSFSGKVMIFLYKTGEVASRKITWPMASTFVKVKRHLISWQNWRVNLAFCFPPIPRSPEIFKKLNYSPLSNLSWVIEGEGEGGEAPMTQSLFFQQFSSRSNSPFSNFSR